MSRVSHLVTLIHSLPATPFRPSGSPQLSDALDAVVRRTFRLPTSSTSLASSSAATSRVPDDIAVSPAQARMVEASITSVERLNSGSALAEFPLTNRTLAPAHDPHMYTRMRDGVHNSMKGVGRSWWKRFFQVRGQI